MASSSERKYDIVLLGATGYTGKYTAEHIATHLPTNIKWAIAGRSESKLSSYAQELKALNPDRSQPAIEVVQQTSNELNALAKQTKVLITTVGPFYLYGKPVVEACVNNGTHYLDCTGETPWVKDMVEQYHEKAKKTGAIIIPQCGVESAPPDLLVLSLTSLLRSSSSLATRELIYTLHEMKSAPSGGTLATVFGIFDAYGAQKVSNANTPGSVCTSKLSQEQQKTYPSAITRLLGARSVQDLGVLTTSLFGQADIPLVYRSWGLLQAQDAKASYGPDFTFRPYLSVRNTFLAVIVHIFSTIGPLFLAFGPTRSLLRYLAIKPGQGPTREETRGDFLEARALALPDARQPAESVGTDLSVRTKAWGRLRFEGSMYHFTGVLLAEAAATILRGDNLPAMQMGGGVLTPATLGQPFIDRLGSVGMVLEQKIIQH